MAETPLRIKIPKRAWPSATPSEKEGVIRDIGRYLRQIDAERSTEMRTYYAWRLFRCIYKQPILVATDRPFRETLTRKVVEMERAMLAEERNDYTDDFLDAAHEVIAMLCEIHEHPDYVE